MGINVVTSSELGSCDLLITDSLNVTSLDLRGKLSVGGTSILGDLVVDTVTVNDSLSVVSNDLIEGLNVEYITDWPLELTNGEANAIVKRDTSGNIEASVLEVDDSFALTPLVVASQALVANLTVTELDDFPVGTAPNSIPLRDGSGGYSANQIRSSVSTGTAPFVVASTAKVTNLNVDSLNGNATLAIDTHKHGFDSTGGTWGSTTADTLGIGPHQILPATLPSVAGRHYLGPWGVALFGLSNNEPLLTTLIWEGDASGGVKYINTLNMNATTVSISYGATYWDS